MRTLPRGELGQCEYPRYLCSRSKDGKMQIDRITEECFNQLSDKEKKALDDSYWNLANRSRDSRSLYFMDTGNAVDTALKLFLGRNDHDGTITVAVRPNRDEEDIGERTHDEWNHITSGFLTAAAIAAGNKKPPYYAQLGILGIEGAVNKEWNDRDIGWATTFHSVRDFVKAVNAVTPEKERVKLKAETLIEPIGRMYEIEGPPSLAELELRRRAHKKAQKTERA